MKVIFLPVLIFFYFISCTGQRQQKIILTITNRSLQPIDSVIIPFNKMSILTKINQNESKTIIADVSKHNSYSEGASGLTIWQNGKRFNATWGFHDMGNFPNTKESIYFFENGINNMDEILKKPEILRIYLINKTGIAIDSIIAEGTALVKQFHHNEFTTKLELNYELFQKAPNLKIIQAGKAYIVNISHDWENWNENTNQESVYLYENGVISKFNKN